MDADTQRCTTFFVIIDYWRSVCCIIQRKCHLPSPGFEGLASRLPQWKEREGTLAALQSPSSDAVLLCPRPWWVPGVAKEVSLSCIAPAS